MVRAVHFVIILMVLIAEQGSGVAAQDFTPTAPRLISEAVQVPNEETLDGISVERTVYFVTPDGTDAIVGPGLYRVEAAEPASLRVLPAKGREGLIIQALTMNYQDTIAEPVALSFSGGDDMHHVVFLLPNGQGLDAVGSYSAVRPRGWNPLPALREWIEKALEKKQKPIRKEEKHGGH